MRRQRLKSTTYWGKKAEQFPVFLYKKLHWTSEQTGCCTGSGWGGVSILLSSPWWCSLNLCLELHWCHIGVLPIASSACTVPKLSLYPSQTTEVAKAVERDTVRRVDHWPKEQHFAQQKSWHRGKRRSGGQHGVLKPNLELFIPPALRVRVSGDVGRAIASKNWDKKNVEYLSLLPVCYHQATCLIFWGCEISFVFIFWLMCLWSDIHPFLLRLVILLRDVPGWKVLIP